MRLSVQPTPARRLPIGNCPGIRIAQITGTKALGSAELFPPGRWRTLGTARPNALAGSGSDLHRLTERMDLGTIQLNSVDRFILVLTELGDRPINDVARVILWQRFGVPVYELYLDHNERVLAYECEAHEGWHTMPGARFAITAGELMYDNGEARVRTGLKRVVDSSPCECGRPGSRILVDGKDLELAPDPLFAAIA